MALKGLVKEFFDPWLLGRREKNFPILQKTSILISPNNIKGLEERIHAKHYEEKGYPIPFHFRHLSYTPSFPSYFLSLYIALVKELNFPS